jgi:hypothetical protein
MEEMDVQDFHRQRKRPQKRALERLHGAIVSAIQINGTQMACTWLVPGLHSPCDW